MGKTLNSNASPLSYQTYTWVSINCQGKPPLLPPKSPLVYRFVGVGVGVRNQKHQIHKYKQLKSQFGFMPTFALHDS